MKRLLNIYLFFSLLFVATALHGTTSDLNIFAQEIKQLKENNSYVKKRIKEIDLPIVKDYLNKVDLLKKTDLIKKTFLQKKESSFWDKMTYKFFKSLIPYNCILLEEEQTPELFKMIKKQATKLNFPVPLIFLCDNKKLFNAGTISIPPYSFLIIGEKLLRSLTKEEFEATISHELAHIKHNHAVKQIAINLSPLALAIPILILTEIFYSKCLANNMNIRIPSRIIFWLTYFIGACYLTNKKSRDFEKQADLTSLKILDNPHSIIGFMNKLEENSDNKLDNEFKFLLDRINEIKEKYPEQANELYKEVEQVHKNIKSNQTFEEYFSTHPKSKDRKEYLEEELAKIQKQNTKGNK